MPGKAAVLFLFVICAAAQNVTIQVGGRTVATRGALNFTNSSGVVEVCSDDQSNNRVNCSASYNSALVATHDTVHANENYCNSTNGSTTYSCNLPNRALTRYQAGMTFLLNTDSACTSSCSLNVDSLGAANIKLADGTTDPGGAIVAGQPQWVFYDGKVFRLVSATGTTARQTDQRGDVMARRLIGAMDTMAYAASIRLDVTAGDLHKTVTTNSAGNATINATTGGLPGQHMWILIANDAISAKTITFGANLRSAGALTGTAGKAATVQFVSDGTAWYEVARTLNL